MAPTIPPVIPPIPQPRPASVYTEPARILCAALPGITPAPVRAMALADPEFADMWLGIGAALETLETAR